MINKKRCSYLMFIMAIDVHNGIPTVMGYFLYIMH